MELAASVEARVRRRVTRGSVPALAARECGARLPSSLCSPRWMMDASMCGPRDVSRCGPREAHAAEMRKLVSLTGHRAAVYCCTFDRTGRRMITGADDYNVKVCALPDCLLQPSP